MEIKVLNSLNNRKTQGGATLLGMLIVGAMIVFVALIAMKMVPAYTEYFSVKQALKAMKQESLSTMSKREIMNSFDRRASTGYIEVVKGSDLIIEKTVGGDTVVSVEYQVIKPIAGNVSVLIDFSASSDSK
jgi:Tfp pilus assembly major pilin PilA